eukprot:1022381-Pelagomonas_calceolata.AAC.3
MLQKNNLCAPKDLEKQTPKQKGSICSVNFTVNFSEEHLQRRFCHKQTQAVTLPHFVPLQVLDGVSRLICRASPFPPPFPPEAPAPTMEPAPENAQTPPPSAAPDPSAAAPLAVPKGAERAPTAQQTALLQYLHDQLLRSNDYARKELLAQWLLGLAGDLRADAGRHGGAGRGSRLGTDRMARSPGTTPADAGRHGGAGRGSRLGTDCMARSPGTTPAPTDQAGDLLAEHAS